MTAVAQQPHPVAAAAAAVRVGLAEVATTAMWSMDPDQTAQTLDDVEVAEAQLRALKSRLLVHAETVEVPAHSGAASTANWLAHRQRLTRREGHRQTRVAKALDAHPLTAQALAEGRVNLEQVEAILRGLDILPEDLDADLKVRAEEHLVGLAQDHDAKALKHLARTILEVVAPEIADEHLARELEREERDAAAAARLSMWEDSHGKVHGKFTPDALTGAMLKKHLHALAAPKHRAASGPLDERRPTPERLGQAFMELVQRYPADRLPNAGGLNATVVVLMHLDTLLGGLKAAELDTGETISPGLARRLACEAGIIPAVLGGNSEVLDLGRRRRFHSTAQRLKATIEHGGCIEEGCEAPPAMTQMHHPDLFAKGGETTVTAGCSAPAPTAASTTPATPTSACPTASSASPAGSEHCSWVPPTRPQPRRWEMYYDSKPCQVCGSEVRLEAKEPGDIEEPAGPVGPEEGYVGGGDPTVDKRLCTNADCPTNTESDRAGEV